MSTNVFPAHSAEDDPNPSIPTAQPVDETGAPLIPDLAGREPTHNESVLIGGQEIHLGSTNVGSIWWAWEQRRLFVRFLDGSLYSYEDVPLSVAVAFVESDSPGRFVWNTLRANNYAYKLLEKGTRKNPPAQVIRRHP